MAQTVAEKMANVAKAIEDLPEDARSVVIEEVENHVASFATPQLNDAQRAEVQRRLARPRAHVLDGDIRVILARYSVAP